jgi:hypothetical protein
VKPNRQLEGVPQSGIKPTLLECAKAVPTMERLQGNKKGL